MHWAVQGRARRGRGRASSGARGLLLRGVRGRRVEDGGRRNILGERVGRLLQYGVGRSDRRLAVRSQRGVRRDGRGVHQGQCLARGRGVPLDRWRAHLAQRGASRFQAHRKSTGTPLGPRHRVRRRTRARVRPQRRARGLPHNGRGRELGAGVGPGRQGRGRGPVHGPRQPACPVRRDVGDSAATLELHQRGAGQRHLPVHRRRRHVGRPHRQPGPARGREGAHRRRGLAGDAGARVGYRRGGGGRPVPLRRRGRDVAASNGRREPDATALVLQPRGRRPTGREHRVGAEPEGVEVDRRREHVHAGDDAAWRQPRPVDRPERHGPDDRGQRRRGVRVVQRRRVVVVHLQPAYGPALPRGDGRPVPVPRVRDAAGQFRGQRPEPLHQGGHRVEGVREGGQLGVGAHRCEARRPGRGVLGHADTRRRLPAAIRPPHGAGPHHHSLAGVQLGLWCEAPQVPLPMDVPYRRLPTRPGRPVRRGERGAEVAGRGVELGGDQPGPDAGRRDEDGCGGRADHPRHDRAGALRHHIRAGRVAPGRGDAVGRVGRRACAPDDERGSDMAERDAAGHARMGDRQHHRSVATRPGDGVHGGHAVQAGRLRGAAVQDYGLTEGRGRGFPTA